MDPRLDADLARLPALLDDAVRSARGWLAGIGERPVAGRGPEPEEMPLPDEGVGAEAALAEFADVWQPLFSASAGPRYLGFVTGGATPGALAGDWVASAVDHNPMSSLDPAGHVLERRTVGWLRELFGLSAAHEGAFVSGATMSNTVGLAVAREWLGEQRGVSVAEDGVAALGPVTVLSANPHSSVRKALSVLGLGRGSLAQVACLPGREAVDPADLERRLAAVDGPCIVVADAGTVDTADFDDLSAVSSLRRRYPFWLHVDGAFGAFAALSPRTSHLVAGLDEADSVCADLHKWLNVPYDSAVQFTRRRDLQERVFRNAAAYLGPSGGVPDFSHLVPENSRRLRALPAWCTLRAYGRAGHREIVERCVDCAHALGEAVAAIPGLRLLAPVRLNVVCFTVEGEPSVERLAALARAVAPTAVLTPTVLRGVPALRAAFSNWRTTADDVRRVARALHEAVRI